tara:strand:- start:1846 stop:2763 length:918 start_codon:yes stop_codon:yes gene_type:complete
MDSIFKPKVQPSGDASKKHLLVIAGADNRAQLLDTLFERCGSYFDSMILTDTGSTDHTKDIAEKHSVRYVKRELNCDLPVCHDLGLELIPSNEWIMLCDSDECPSKPLLDGIERITSDANHLKIAKYLLPCRGHWFDISGNLVGDSTFHTVENNWRHLLDPNQNFAQPRLIKKTKDLHIKYRASHYSFVNEGTAIYQPLPWNHYKGVKSRSKSAFIHGLSFPEEHDFTGKEAEDWKVLKRKLGVSMKDISLWTALKKAPEECLSLWKSWRGLSEDNVANCVYMFVFEFDWDGEEPKCNETCCDYS